MEADPSPVRETKSIVVRALCDILRPVITNIRILELFAGTGKVSSALLEEGARQSLAVDLRPSPDQIPENIQWHQQSVESFLRDNSMDPFDVIFMDPPYDSDYANEILFTLANNQWLSENGILVIETGLGVDLPDQIEGGRTTSLMRKRKYGGTRLWIYQSDRMEPGYQE